MSAFDGFREAWDHDTAEHGVLPWLVELVLLGLFFALGLPAILLVLWGMVG